MNIFATSDSPEACAEFLDDKRLVKMALETTQLISNAVILYGGISPYKLAHPNHPSTLWAAKNLRQFAWLADHGLYLFREYHKRYNKIHKSSNVLLWLVGEVAQSKRIPDTDEPLEFIYVGWDIYKPGVGVAKDVHEAYRFYLQGKWKEQAEAGRPPKWYGKEDPTRYE